MSPVVYSCVALLAVSAVEPPVEVRELLDSSCVECHAGDEPAGGLDLTSLPFDLQDRNVLRRWTQVFDRTAGGEMPPQPDRLPPARRAALLKALEPPLHEADLADVRTHGRGALRRLTRDEYQQNLRDLLALPALDVRDLLPEDRAGRLFPKNSSTLDVSRVQLAGYLDAAEAALKAAAVDGPAPPPTEKYRATGLQLFPERSTFGEGEAMFFAKDGRAVEGKALDELAADPALEMALFRSAHWPYYGYPRGFVARRAGDYRVRFSARAVRQLPGRKLEPAERPVAMTFRARKPSGPDVSGDVRATGGLIDLGPDARQYETIVRLLPGETFEYSLLGLPVPLARNVDGGPPTYRYPPLPPRGQPGAAFQWLEIEGPLAPTEWPPESHRVLFDATGTPPKSDSPALDARRLLRRFVDRAAREPLDDERLAPFLGLVERRLAEGRSLADSLTPAYQAFLCSTEYLFLREPRGASDVHAVAERLAHFLTESGPDAELREAARSGRLRESAVRRAETARLIDSPKFERFVKQFTDYWLDLRHVRRDEADVRLYPEYRFDDYLVESMERETREFVMLAVRDNLPATVVVDADFLLVNDRLAQHYGLDPVDGSALRKVPRPPGSPYGGLLAQAALLKVTANGTATSPVVRGAWVTDRLLGEPPPPPPPSVPAIEPDIRGATTIREQLALHARAQECAACHARFDPVGFGLENFDVFGGWRSRYRTIEGGERVAGIDRAGHDFQYGLAGTVDASSRLKDGGSFRDVRELKLRLLAEPRRLARNVLHQLTAYSTGAPVRFSDRRDLETLLDRCAPDGYRLRDLLVELVDSRIFLGTEPPR